MSAALILALGTSNAGASGPKVKKQERRVTVTVHRVAQISDLDHSTLFITKDRADFYALVTIDGNEMKTKVFSEDDGRPYWTLTGFTNKSIVPIRIQLKDQDGGLENKDDYVDINPVPGHKDLMIWFNMDTGQVWGDIEGRAGAFLHSVGNGDQSLGQIWFTVQ